MEYKLYNFSNSAYKFNVLLFAFKIGNEHYKKSMVKFMLIIYMIFTQKLNKNTNIGQEGDCGRNFKVSCFSTFTGTFFSAFSTNALCFHFAPNLLNYVAGPGP